MSTSFHWCGEFLSISFKNLFNLRHSDEDSDLTESVIRTLANIARRVDGALAVADTFFLDLLDTLLESPRPQIWRWTCEMVGNLARQESIADAVVHGTPWRSIVALLQ